MRNITGLPLFVLLSILFFFTVPAWQDAHAEANFSVYLGISSSSNNTVTAYETPSSSATREVDFSDYSSYGVDIKYWLDPSPRNGLGTSLYTFQADSAGVDIDLLSYSFLYMHRLMLAVDDQYAYGRIQPYIGFGLVACEVNADADFHPDLHQKVETSGSANGYEFRTGVRWLLTPHTSILTEYMYTNIDIDVQGQFLGFYDRIITSLHTDHFFGGISWSF